MPARIEQETLLTEIADLKRRLRNLESAPQAPNRSQRGGTFRLIPEDGGPESLLYFGNFTDDSTVDRYGVALYDTNGETVLATAEDAEGLLFPGDLAQWAVPTVQTITSGSFVTVAEVQLHPRAHNTFYSTAAIICDVGTTAEVKVTNGVSATSTITIPSGGNGNMTLNWKHPFGSGWEAPAALGSSILSWQVRRASGAGNVYAYPTRSLWLCNSSFTGATTSPGLSFV